MNNIYQHKQLQERQSTSPALTSSAPAKSDELSSSKLSVACRGENTLDSGRTNVVKHTVFVLGVNGNPLTPTNRAKARKLLKGGVAKKIWSKFGTFGVQLIQETREEVPKTSLGVDPGAKYDGFSVVRHKENNLSIKLDLPHKKKIVRKLKERREARRTRRSRLRRREARWSNRSRSGFIAPSQMVLIQSRLKIVDELCRIYPISIVGLEDVRFNHKKHRWGKFFSSVEIGKNRTRKWFDERKIERIEFQGYETAELRKHYGYKKTRSKSADKFSAHCSDSLTLATSVLHREYVEPGTFLVVDDTYRCVRRKLYDSNFQAGGVKEKYSCGTVLGLRKGLIIGTNKGKIGQLCGMDRGSFRYRDSLNKRQTVKKLSWISSSFKVRRILSPSQGKPCGSRQT